MVKCVSPHPATTLSVREDGARLAVGNVEGTVLVYRLPGFAKVRALSRAVPLTGGVVGYYLGSRKLQKIDFAGDFCVCLVSCHASQDGTPKHDEVACIR